MAAEGLGNTHIPPRPCLKPNEMPCHQSNFLGGWLLPRGLLVFQVEFEAQPGLFFFFLLRSLLLTKSPKFPLSLQISFVWLSSSN